MVFNTHPEVCKFINDKRLCQSQILSITHGKGFYTLFYYA